MLETMFINLLLEYPHAASVLALIGAARVLNKPLFALLHAVVDVTKTDIDNKYLKAIEESRAYKLFLFILDLTLSVKVK